MVILRYTPKGICSGIKVTHQLTFKQDRYLGGPDLITRTLQEQSLWWQKESQDSKLRKDPRHRLWL